MSSFWGVRPPNGWKSANARSMVSSWLMGDDIHEAEHSVPCVHEKRADPSLDTEHRFVVLLSYVQARTLGHKRGTQGETKHNSFVAKEVVESMSNLEQDFLVRRCTEETTTQGDELSGSTHNESKLEKKAYLWLDKLARHQMVSDQASWNGLTSILYSQYPVLVVACLYGDTDESIPNRVKAVEEAQIPRLIRRFIGLDRGNKLLNSEAFFRGWPWLERTFALLQSIDAFRAKTQPETQRCFSFCCPICRKRYHVPQTRAEKSNPSKSVRIDNSNCLHPPVMLSPLTREMLFCDAAIILAGTWASDVLASVQVGETFWHGMNRLYDRLGEDAEEVLSNLRFDELLSLLEEAEWERDGLIALMQYSSLYHDENHGVPPPERVLAHFLSLLSGGPAAKEERRTVAHQIMTGGLGSADLHDQFDLLTALVTNENQRVNKDFEADCFSNPCDWIQNCFELHLPQVAAQLVGDPKSVVKAVSILREWQQLDAEQDHGECSHDSQSCAKELEHDVLDLSVRGVWRVAPPNDQLGMAGVFTPFLAKKSVPSEVESCMGRWTNGFNQLRRHGQNSLSEYPWSRHYMNSVSCRGNEVCRSCGNEPELHKVFFLGWHCPDDDRAMLTASLVLVCIDDRCCVSLQEVCVLRPLSPHVPSGLNLGIPEWTSESSIPLLSIVTVKPEEIGMGVPQELKCA